MRRLRTPFYQLAFLVCILPALFAVALAQPPDRKKEEEDKPKPPMGKKEEEEGGDTNPGKVFRIEDPRPDPGKTPVSPSDIDLATAARRAAHPAVRKLFEDLILPRDVVEILGQSARTESVYPLSDFIGARQSKVAKVNLKKLDEKTGKIGTEYQMPTASIREVVHYEQLAVREVKKFLGTPDTVVPKAERLNAAEQVLAAVARFHDSASSDGTRKGEGWNRVREELRAQLLEVGLERLLHLIEEKDWPSAIRALILTARRFPSATDHLRLAPPTGTLVDKVVFSDLPHNQRNESLRHLRHLAESMPSSDVARAITDKLKHHAMPFILQAQKAQKEGRLNDVQDLVRKAEGYYPDHPGLIEMRSGSGTGDRTLRVAVKTLPVFLSPSRAFTDSEKQAVEMIFEGLYELGPEPDGGRFRPTLACGRPALVPLGREIALPRDACWANGDPITASDISYTLSRLRHPDYRFRSHAWADDLIDKVDEIDPLRFRLTLRQGYLDPLALMTFKLLPQKSALPDPDDERFAKDPIGSGPFKYDSEPASDRGRTALRFLANPEYRKRPGRLGLPRLSEVFFLPYNHELSAPEKASPDAHPLVKEMKSGGLDIILDAPPALLGSLRNVPGVQIAGPLPTRRIYFLAVNNARNHLDNAALRRAIAMAIPREKLLAEFRGGVAGLHHVLNGPYPVNTWASDPSVKIDPNRALAALKEAKQTELPVFTLLYPSDDSVVERAMTALALHVKEVLHITLKPMGLTPSDLRKRVELNRDYDLAYYCYDFPDATYWLLPLLDPRGNDRLVGRNFFNYTAASELAALCQDALKHRNFERVRDITHTIHRVFVQQDMPFIPLWQLDRHIAVAGNLEILDGATPLKYQGAASAIDPLRVFATIEAWRKNK